MNAKHIAFVASVLVSFVAGCTGDVAEEESSVPEMESTLETQQDAKGTKKSDAGSQPFLKVELKEVFVSSY
ncbi:MAG: hypothetical protein IPG50_09690 [Myxococcales bacterium]|nr:hypothetical protein [Myxococcales bacterium]